MIYKVPVCYYAARCSSCEDAEDCDALGASEVSLCDTCLRASSVCVTCKDGSEFSDRECVLSGGICSSCGDCFEGI